MTRALSILLASLCLGGSASGQANYSLLALPQAAAVTGGSQCCVIEGNGSGDAITGSFPTGGNTWSISFWAYPIPSSGGFACLLTVGSSAGLYYRDATRKLDFENGGAQLSDTALTESAWQHVVVSCNAGTITFYLNGAADGTATGGTHTFSHIFNDGAGDHFKGRLAQMAVYSIALNGTQAANLASKATTPDVIGSLVTYLKLDDIANGASGNGSTFADSSGNGRTGTGIGTTGRTADF